MTASALAAVLARIPPGDYEHQIACGPGWHPLIARLDATLAELDPGYEVHGVGSLHGSLRFHAMPAGAPEPDCCLTWRADHPQPADAAPQPDWNHWFDDLYGHQASVDHRDPIRRAFGEAIRDAERESSTTCEPCGAKAAETCVGLDGGIRTLCKECMV